MKVIKTFDLSTRHNINWFVDTYNFEGVYQDDLHLYVKQEGQKYGDMGFIVNAKEEINDMATPCITITAMTKEETTKATDTSLYLYSWAPIEHNQKHTRKGEFIWKAGHEHY